jgi:hypothetical protein
MPSDEDHRAVWLAEGMALVQAWDREHMTRMLSTMDAARLADRTSSALQWAFERGREQKRPED